jgi:hypothetical protein
VFTLLRSERSRWTDPGVHLGPKRAPKEEIAARIAELRAKYPTVVRRETPRIGTGLTLTTAAAIAAPFSDPTDEEIARYNRELKDFVTGNELYLMKSRDHENSLGRAIELTLTLQNKGTALAEDIRLSLSLPDGLTVYDKEGRPSGPQPPTAPHPPRGLHEQMIAAIRSNATFLYHDPTFPIYPIRCNVSPPSIKKRTNGFLVEFSIEKLIQHRPESLDPLYLLFDSFDSGESFHIDWRGVSASLPQPVTGRLDVVVQKIAA